MKIRRIFTALFLVFTLTLMNVPTVLAAPAAPIVSSTTPASPANNNSPKVIGSAEAGSTVKIYTDSSCTSAVAGSGTAANFASPGITVSVSDNTTTSFYATATNAADEVSSCSSTFVTYIEDSTAPSVSMSSATPDPTKNSPIPVTVTFSEPVTGFESSDITPVNYGTVSNFTGSGANYSFNLIPSGQVTVTANILANVAQDAAGNGNTAAATFSRTYDSVSPTVSMNSATSNPTNISPIPVTVTFSEPVTGFESSDITPVNYGIVSNFTGSGASYSFNLTPSGQVTVSANISAGIAQDAAGNSNTAAAPFSRTYDSIAPVISAVAPTMNAVINNITTSSAVSYTVDGTIASGSIIMTRTGGTGDAASPHTCTLKGTALNAGAHNNVDLSDTTNVCTVPQSLVSGAIYTFTFNATDAAGNPATVMSTNVTFDNSIPAFSAVAPAVNAIINNITTASDVSYTLSKAIASGSITMTRTGGTNDPSVHTCTLRGTALNAGAHNNFNLSDTTNACTIAQSLMSGSIYTFDFNGTDAVGNVAATVTITGVTFDNTLPVISEVAPASNAVINNITTSSAVSYTLSETIASGRIRMTWTGGTNDGASPHTCTLKSAARIAGAHNNVNLSDTTNVCAAPQTLVSGAVYTFTFDATDTAGNPAATVTRTNVTFDNTPPTITIEAPSVLSTRTGPVTYTITYADTNFNVSTLVFGDITLNRTGDADGLVSITGSDLTYTVTISGITGSNGTLGISIAANTASDLAGNLALAAGPSTTFAVDRVAPIVSWRAPVTDKGLYYVSNEPFQLAATACDNVGITEVVFSRWDYENLVEIEIGRVTIGTVTIPPSDSPCYSYPFSYSYSFTFDTSVLLPKWNEIHVKAYDAVANASQQKYIWLYHYPVLTVTKAGTGIGRVTSSPAGINCGATCSYGFPDNTVVTLTAVPTYPYFFVGWSGAGCSGTGTCTVTMDSAKSVTAPFALTIYKGFLPMIFR